MSEEDALRAAVNESLSLYIFDNAVFLAERLSTAYPTDDNLHLLAHCHVQAGDAGTAFRLLETRCAASVSSGMDVGRSWRLLYLYGVACAMTGRLQECIRVMRALSWGGIPPSAMAGVLHWRGTCESRLGHGSAANTLTEAVETNPALFTSFERSVTHHRPSSSAASAYAAVPAEPREEGQGLRAQLRTALGPFARVSAALFSFRSKEALSLIAALPRAERHAAWGHRAAALAHFHSSQNAEAAERFRSMLEAAPWAVGDASIVHYSTALWHLRDAPRLSALTQRLISTLGAQHAVALAVAGNYYSLQRDRTKAIQLLTRAAELEPALAPAHALLGYELLSDGKVPQAAAAFSEALRCNPRAYIAIAGIGEIELGKGNVARAREHFSCAMAINPLASIVNRYASTLHGRDATPEMLHRAVELYDRVLSADAMQRQARHQRAAVLMALDRHVEALEELSALRHAGGVDEPAVHFTTAKCLLALNMKEQAVAALGRTVEMDPRYTNDAKALLDAA